MGFLERVLGDNYANWFIVGIVVFIFIKASSNNKGANGGGSNNSAPPAPPAQ